MKNKNKTTKILVIALFSVVFIGIFSGTVAGSHKTGVPPMLEKGNQSPQNNTLIEDSNIKLSIPVKDPDFAVDTDELSVEFYVDDKKVGSKKVEQNKTVSYSYTPNLHQNTSHKTWSVKVTDLQGHHKTTPQYNFKIKSSPPNIEIKDNTTVVVRDPDFKDRNEKLNINISLGPKQILGSITQNQTYNLSTDSLDPGNYTLKAEAIDQYSRQDITTKTHTIKGENTQIHHSIDTTKPVFDNSRAEPSHHRKIRRKDSVKLSVPVNYTGFSNNESVDVDFYVDTTFVGTDYLSKNRSANVSWSPTTQYRNKTYQWHAEAIYNDEQNTSYSGVYRFNYTTFPPRIQTYDIYNNSGSLYVDLYDRDIEYRDDNVSLKYNLSNSRNTIYKTTNGIFNLTDNFSSGNYTLDVELEDQYSHKNSYTLNFSVNSSDTNVSSGNQKTQTQNNNNNSGSTKNTQNYTPNIYSSTAQPKGDKKIDVFNPQIRITDKDFPKDELTAKLYIDGGANQQKQLTYNQSVLYNVDTSNLKDGRHTWHIEITDKHGNKITSKKYKFELDTGQQTTSTSTENNNGDDNASGGSNSDNGDGQSLDEFSDTEETSSSGGLLNNPLVLLIVIGIVVLGLYKGYDKFYSVDIPDPDEREGGSKQEKTDGKDSGGKNVEDEWGGSRPNN